jgi:hypothetical protein
VFFLIFLGNFLNFSLRKNHPRTSRNILKNELAKSVQPFSRFALSNTFSDSFLYYIYKYQIAL